jgi:ATP-dependent helicase/nuclease subunit A
VDPFVPRVETKSNHGDANVSALTDSQRRAIEGSGNVLVVAGAGTGKTRTLVERCLARVCNPTKPVSLGRILMVTFTEAAAGEMRKRLRDELEKQAGAHPDNAWLAEQLALVEMARISTLHSFCLQLVREHFHELGLDPQLTVLPDEQARLLARQTLDRVLRRHYAGGTAIAEAVQQLILEQGRGWDEPIRNLVLRAHHYTQTLCDPEAWFREQLAVLQHPRPERWERWLLEGVNPWRQTWLPVLQSQPKENRKAHRCAASLEGLPEEATREQIAAALAQVLDADGDWTGQRKGAHRDPIEKFFDDAAFLHSVAAVSAGVDPLAQDREWVRPHMIALLELTQDFAREFARAKRELAGLDFQDLEQFALQLLCHRASRRPTDRALYWRERLELVFVDEYQDINEAQDTILRALGREGAEANRFLVGDIKQSIYRFRLANPRIFQRYAEMWRPATEDVRLETGPPNPPLTPPRRGTRSPGRGTSGGASGSPPPEGLGAGLAAAGQVISLADNFRSHEAILNFVNTLFADLMRKEVGGVEYDEAQRLQFGAAAERPYFLLKADSSTRVELHLGLTGTGGGETENGEDTNLVDSSNVAKEARWAALRLRELRGRFQVWDEGTRQLRPVEWSDMAILLRSPRHKAENYAKVFEEVGVPLTVARGGFFENQEVFDLLSLLQLLDNPLQDLPLLAALRSPLVGLTLDQLATIRLAQPRGYFWTALRRFHSDKQPRAAASPSDSNPDQPPPAPVAASEQSRGEILPILRAGAWPKVDLFLRRFENWRRLARQVSLSQSLETVLDETCYEAWLLAQSRGQQRWANAQRLLALTRQFDQFQRQGLFRFLNYVEAQREAEVDMEPASVTTDNAVRLMSIHQSKGLEFPVVLVADLGKRFNFDDLKERVILDEEFGLCPRVRPPHAGQLYPSLPYWLAKRRQQRESLGEELRLLYVALTRARDKLILSGVVSAKTVAEKWTRVATGQPTPDASQEGNCLRRSAPLPGGAGGGFMVPTQQILEANSYLDWLGAWLPSATDHSDWTTSGQSSLLEWTIYQEGDERLAGQVQPSGKSAASTPLTEAIAPAAWESLLQRLAWRYPFAAATTEPAKTSASALRRRLREETDDEAESLFQIPSLQFHSRRRSRNGTTQLSAAKVGTAHHLFLQWVPLERVTRRLDLVEEAERMRHAAVLSDEEVAALDFDALLAFWQSDLGRKIRAQEARYIHRELPFTARMSRADLEALKLSLNAGLPDDEFVVVQGFADLAVILPEEIWLVDFKTDHVDRGAMAAVVQFYEPQLKLYALALGRIYRRPVTGAWLHFLSLKQLVAVIA